MAAGAVTEVVIEEVAENLEGAAAAARRINVQGCGYFFGGFSVGLAIGFVVGNRYNKKKLRAEAFESSEEEVELIRETYRSRAIAAQPKPTADEIIKERGYLEVSEDEPQPRSLRAPVPITSARAEVHHVDKTKDEGWDFPTELAQRNPDEPYVIHQDEFKGTETGYEQVAYTYYSGDDVLAGEDDKPIPHADVIVGHGNLKWGHGSDDEDVVFVRNDKLELEMEICRSPKSFEEEVLGLEHSDSASYERMNKRRTRFDSDDTT